MPIFGTRLVPVYAKVLFGLALTLIVFPIVRIKVPATQGFSEDLIALCAREALVGVMMGFVARMIFFAVEVAGQMVGFSMGLSAAQLMNPAFGESSAVIEQFKNIMAILLFLVINGHHLYIEALFKSYDLAPVGILSFGTAATASLAKTVQEVFLIALKLAGPMIAVMVMMNLAVGVIGKFVPQINVFVVSFSVTILGGLFVFIMSLPLVLHVLEADMFQMTSRIFDVVKGF
jgi:flagellar biosynthetic protein FliR